MKAWARVIQHLPLTTSQKVSYLRPKSAKPPHAYIELIIHILSRDDVQAVCGLQKSLEEGPKTDWSTLADTPAWLCVSMAHCKRLMFPNGGL